MSTSKFRPKPVQAEITGVLREDGPEVEEIARKLFPGDYEMSVQNDPELLTAAQKVVSHLETMKEVEGAGVFREDGDHDPKPLHPSELVGRILYTKMDGAEREVGIVLDYTSDSVVVGVNRK